MTNEEHRKYLLPILKLLRSLDTRPDYTVLQQLGEALNDAARTNERILVALVLPLYEALPSWRDETIESSALSHRSHRLLRAWINAILLLVGVAREGQDESNGQIISKLKEIGRTVAAGELIPADGPPEAQKLVETDPFAFLLAACIDRQMRAEVVWAIPYWSAPRI